MSKNTVDDLVCREERKDYYNVEDLTCKEEPKKEYVVEDLTFDDNTTDNYITEYLEFGLNNYEKEYQDWILHIDNVDSSRYDFLLVKKWNFCCCGCPKDAVLAVKEMLDWCGEDIASRKSPSEFTNYQKFMLYFLDNKGYTEHGGSVNGSWLTNDGKDILQFINYALEQDEKD